MTAITAIHMRTRAFKESSRGGGAGQLKRTAGVHLGRRLATVGVISVGRDEVETVAHGASV
jgi:hypothetical protein